MTTRIIVGYNDVEIGILLDDSDYFALVGKHLIETKDGSIYVSLNNETQHLAHWLLQPPDGMYADHISRDKRDCRRSNLRIVTQTQNCQNRNINSNNTSGFSGVQWNAANRNWRALIRINGTRYTKSGFVTAEAGARWRDTLIKQHGSFHPLAFPDAMSTNENPNQNETTK